MLEYCDKIGLKMIANMKIRDKTQHIIEKCTRLWKVSQFKSN